MYNFPPSTNQAKCTFWKPTVLNLYILHVPTEFNTFVFSELYKIPVEIAIAILPVDKLRSQSLLVRLQIFPDPNLSPCIYIYMYTKSTVT